MTALVTKHLPLVAGAPDGIKKLRALILELAVRGKLSTQLDAEVHADGPEVSRSPDSERSCAGGPYTLPKSWRWVRLGDTLEMINGRAFKPSEWIHAGLPIVRIQNLNRRDAEFNYCDESTLASRHIIDTGTMLISWSGTPGTSFGAFIWDRGRSALNQHIFSCFQRCPSFFDRFLQIAINTRLEELIAKAHGGVGLQHVTKGKLEALTLALPPLKEQYRIVAKVDELMALCDRLEADQADAEAAHAQLVQALLHSLTQATDAADFRASWQRLSEHFHTLFTTEASVDELKQTVLQLAVMGKLVQRYKTGEPTSTLRRQSTVSEAKAKDGEDSSAVRAHTRAIQLPQSWEWRHIADVVSIKHGYAFSSSHFLESVGPYVLTTPGNFFECGGFKDRGGRTKYFDGPVSEEFVLKPGDLVVAMTEQAAGLLGSAAFIPNDGRTYLHNQRLGKLSFDQSLLAPKYLFHFFNCSYLRACVAGSSTGMKVKHTSPEKIGRVLFPLPPLAEQHRIVAKVDELMALCDQLKAQLQQARQQHAQLTSVLVEQAVAA